MRKTIAYRELERQLYGLRADNEWLKDMVNRYRAHIEHSDNQRVLQLNKLIIIEDCLKKRGFLK